MTFSISIKNINYCVIYLTYKEINQYNVINIKYAI